MWRHQDETGNSTSVRVLGEDDLIVNLAVWESVDHLRAFADDGEHRSMMRRRREWFLRKAEPFLVLWWVPAGHVPSVEEAETKLVALRRNGPTAEAFTFASLAPVPR